MEQTVKLEYIVHEQQNEIARLNTMLITYKALARQYQDELSKLSQQSEDDTNGNL